MKKQSILLLWGLLITNITFSMHVAAEPAVDVVSHPEAEAGIGKVTHEVSAGAKATEAAKATDAAQAEAARAAQAARATTGARVNAPTQLTTYQTIRLQLSKAATHVQLSAIQVLKAFNLVAEPHGKIADLQRNLASISTQLQDASSAISYTKGSFESSSQHLKDLLAQAKSKQAGIDAINNAELQALIAKAESHGQGTISGFDEIAAMKEDLERQGKWDDYLLAVRDYGTTVNEIVREMGSLAGTSAPLVSAEVDAIANAGIQAGIAIKMPAPAAAAPEVSSSTSPVVKPVQVVPVSGFEPIAEKEAEASQSTSTSTVLSPTKDVKLPPKPVLKPVVKPVVPVVAAKPVAAGVANKLVLAKDATFTPLVDKLNTLRGDLNTAQAAHDAAQKAVEAITDTFSDEYDAAEAREKSTATAVQVAEKDVNVQKAAIMQYLETNKGVAVVEVASGGISVSDLPRDKQLAALRFDKALGVNFGVAKTSSASAKVSPAPVKAAASGLFAGVDLAAMSSKVSETIAVEQKNLADKTLDQKSALLAQVRLKALTNLDTALKTGDVGAVQAAWENLTDSVKQSVDKDLYKAEEAAAAAKLKAEQAAAKATADAKALAQSERSVAWKSLTPSEKMATPADATQFRQEVTKAQLDVIKKALSDGPEKDTQLLALMKEVSSAQAALTKINPPLNPAEISKMAAAKKAGTYIPVDPVALQNATRAVVDAQSAVMQHISELITSSLSDTYGAYATLGVSEIGLVGISAPVNYTDPAAIKSAIDIKNLDTKYNALITAAQKSVAEAKAAASAKSEATPAPAPIAVPVESAASPAAPTSPTINGKDVTTFARMKKNGVPDGAINQKMGAAGFTSAEISDLLAGKFDAAPSAAASAPVESVSASSVVMKVDASLVPYLRRLKMGTPSGAVQNKMKTDGMSVADMELVEKVSGMSKDAIGSIIDASTGAIASESASITPGSSASEPVATLPPAITAVPAEAPAPAPAPAPAVDTDVADFLASYEAAQKANPMMKALKLKGVQAEYDALTPAKQALVQAEIGTPSFTVAKVAKPAVVAKPAASSVPVEIPASVEPVVAPAPVIVPSDLTPAAPSVILPKSGSSTGPRRTKGVLPVAAAPEPVVVSPGSAVDSGFAS